METNNKSVDFIRELLNECVEEARTQGFEGGFQDYEFTEDELEYVIDKLGYKPSEEEWKAAGIEEVDGAHVSGSGEAAP